jgi:hypothetical protein
MLGAAVFYRCAEEKNNALIFESEHMGLETNLQEPFRNFQIPLTI